MFIYLPADIKIECINSASTGRVLLNLEGCEAIYATPINFKGACLECVVWASFAGINPRRLATAATMEAAEAVVARIFRGLRDGVAAIDLNEGEEHDCLPEPIRVRPDGKRSEHAEESMLANQIVGWR